MYSVPAKIRSRNIENVNGLSMHILEAGYEDIHRPCLLLLHGFPELSFSWRKIMIPLAEQGFYVIAPDQRGYGLTTGWKNNYEGDISEYFIINIVSDVVHLLNNLNIKKVYSVVGHDFGSFVAGYSALIRPDLFNSVVLMSAPFSGPPNISSVVNNNEKNKIHEDLLNLRPPRKHYQWYFSEKQSNDNMLNCAQGLHSFLRSYYHFKSADWKKNKPFKLKNWSAEDLEALPRYYIMDSDKGMAETVHDFKPDEKNIFSCKWLTDIELANYTNKFSETGFQGGLNWYRCMIDESYSKKLELYSGLTIDIPSYFIAGESDWGVFQKPGSFEDMYNRVCTNMKKPDLIRGAGHWVQQEKHRLTIEKLLEFFNELNIKN